VVSGPRPNDTRLIEVEWKRTRWTLFVVDLKSRGNAAGIQLGKAFYRLLARVESFVANVRQALRRV